MRQARSISFKIDVCNYLVKSNGNVSATAKHFNIYRKQVRYYKRKHQLYVAFSNKIQKKTWFIKTQQGVVQNTLSKNNYYTRG